MTKKTVALVIPGQQEVAVANPKPAFSMTTILIIGVILIVAYFICKNRGKMGNYTIEENWRINEFNAHGIPMDITISRHFTRG